MIDENLLNPGSAEHSQIQETSAAEEDHDILSDAMRNPEVRKLLDEDQVVELYHVFDMFDTDGSGDIDVKELKQVMYDLKMNPTEEEIKKMIAEYDTDKTETIDFIEFLVLMGKKLAEDELDEEMVDSMKWMDKDQDKYIDAFDMRQSFVELGLMKPSELHSDHCESFIKILDPRKQGHLDFEEFVQAFMAK